MFQVGIVTMGGRQVGVVTQSQGEFEDTFAPDLNGYEPEGRADATLGAGRFQGQPELHANRHRHAVGHHGWRPQHAPTDHNPTNVPSGKDYVPSEKGRPVHQGSEETDQAIVDASQAHHLDPNLMRATASIESGNDPSSNANRSTQYKGLFQMGTRGPDSEWARFGNGGNPYSAHDNAMAAARAWDANRTLFHKRFGRDPTDTELYLMHQQGLGFYTRGAMTNIAGNPYPGMHGPQTHESFEAGWGRELARRKAAFAASHPVTVAAKPFDPETDVP